MLTSSHCQLQKIYSHILDLHYFTFLCFVCVRICFCNNVTSSSTFLSFPFLSYPFLSFPYLTFPFLSLCACATCQSCILSSIKVDCIFVNTLPVKTFIDDHIQQLFDALLGSLRHSISTHLQSIDSFLTEAHSSLSVRPQTIEEISQVNQTHSQLAKQKPVVSLHSASSDRPYMCVKSS